MYDDSMFGIKRPLKSDKKKLKLGGKHISLKELKQIAEGLGIDLVKHTKGYNEAGHTPRKASASTILQRVKDKIKIDGWTYKEWMDTYIELNKPTAKMPEHLTGMVSTSAMLSPGMMSTPTQTGLDDDDFLQSLLNSVEGKSSEILKPEIYNKKTFKSCDDITNKHHKLQKIYNNLHKQYIQLAREFANWQDKPEECNNKIKVITQKFKDYLNANYSGDVTKTSNFIKSLTNTYVSPPKTSTDTGGSSSDISPVVSFGKKRKNKRKVKKSPKKSPKKTKRKLYKGSRGGTYYMRKGKKVYI